ncbi:MAG: TrkA-N domain protein [Deltaproteobacteria bacterium]|nr:TrkA-N domain protein [Deltaproteobacteria bacterium]
MYIVIIGCGRVGSQLASLLAQEKHDIVVIDKDVNAFKNLGTAFNGVKLHGYGYDEEVLQKAHIERCDAFAAVTDLDNANIMACEVASKLYKVPRVIARVYNPGSISTFQELGLDYVFGTNVVAQTIMDKLVQGHGRHLSIRGDVEVIEFIAGSRIENLRLIDVQIPNEFRICLVTRQGKSFIPWRETVLKDGDNLLAVVKSNAYSRIKQYMRGS